MKKSVEKSIAIKIITFVCMLAMANFAGCSQSLPYSIVGTGQTRWHNIFPPKNKKNQSLVPVS